MNFSILLFFILPLTMCVNGTLDTGKRDKQNEAQIRLMKDNTWIREFSFEEFTINRQFNPASCQAAVSENNKLVLVFETYKTFIGLLHKDEDGIKKTGVTVEGCSCQDLIDTYNALTTSTELNPNDEFLVVVWYTICFDMKRDSQEKEKKFKELFESLKAYSLGEIVNLFIFGRQIIRQYLGDRNLNDTYLSFGSVMTQIHNVVKKYEEEDADAQLNVQLTITSLQFILVTSLPNKIYSSILELPAIQEDNMRTEDEKRAALLRKKLIRITLSILSEEMPVATLFTGKDDESKTHFPATINNLAALFSIDIQRDRLHNEATLSNDIIQVIKVFYTTAQNESWNNETVRGALHMLCSSKMNYAQLLNAVNNKNFNKSEVQKFMAANPKEILF